MDVGDINVQVSLLACAAATLHPADSDSTVVTQIPTLYIVTGAVLAKIVVPVLVETGLA
jgi:hypothetical protein